MFFIFLTIVLFIIHKWRLEKNYNRFFGEKQESYTQHGHNDIAKYLHELSKIQEDNNSNYFMVILIVILLLLKN